jgi:hypothetical protein
MLKLHGIAVSNYTNMVTQCLLEKGIEFEQLDASPSRRCIPPMRHLGAAFFGRERSEDAYTEVRPQVEKGLQAFRQLANFGP